MTLDFRQFKVLTFDCFGTLIDWETGILTALRPILKAHAVAALDGELLTEYARQEAIAEEEYQPYRGVLREVTLGLGQHYGFTPDDVQAGTLATSLPEWPPFPDTVESLRALKQRYQLAAVTNCDDDLFAETQKRLEAPFDFVITAEGVGAYKPSRRVFDAALERVGVPKEQVLHVAESLRHDIAPARELGLATVWVNRHADRPGPSASGEGIAVPDLEIPDLATLVKLIEESS